MRISDWSSDVCSSDLTALAASPAVSVYVDQAPLSFSALPGIGVGLDMERVEVLKGPQGILFGQNSTGGAINYIANKPTDTLTSGFSLGYGRFSTVEGEAFISGPVTDTLNIRLAGRSTYRSEEHTSELQSLMRISYAVFCLKKTSTQHKLTQ